MASDADDGLSLPFLVMWQPFCQCSSISNNSGDGRSELYWFTHALRSTGIEEHKIDGMCPNSLTAMIDESENC